MKILALFLMLLSSTFAQMPVIPLPNPLPVMGYAGATFTDPRYGTTITQCTDQTTDPTNTVNYSFDISNSSSSGEFVWSQDGSMLIVVRAGTGTTEVVSWDGTNCKMIAGTQLTGATFSHVSRKVYYPQGTQIWQMDLTVSPPVSTQVGDFAPCLPAGFVPQWHTALSTMDGDDAIAYGVSAQPLQNTGAYMLVWTKNGCHVWNTQAATIDGVSLTGIPGFLIHDAFMYPGGWIVVAVGGTSCTSCPKIHGPFLWLANTNVVNMTTVNPGGHEVMGHQTFVNLDIAPKVGARLAAYPNTVRFLSSNTGIVFPGPQDSYMGWQDSDPLDLSRFFGVQMSFPGSGNVPVPISVPLQGEIWLEDPTSGNITRQGHCFSSGVPNDMNFRAQRCTSAMSPDGKWIAFSSDWMGTLGNTQNLGPSPTWLQRLLGNFRPTPQPCILGAKKPNECQSQVFILQVKK